MNMKLITISCIITCIASLPIPNSEVTTIENGLQEITGEWCGNITCNEYQECKNDVCVCYKCLIKTNTTCEVPECYKFDSVNKVCEQDGKDYITALMLQIFLGTWGGGMWYLENYLWAGCQLGLLLLVCFTCCCDAQKNDGCKCIGMTLKFSGCCAALIWWAICIAWIVEGKIIGPDGCELVGKN